MLKKIVLTAILFVVACGVAASACTSTAEPKTDSGQSVTTDAPTTTETPTTSLAPETIPAESPYQPTRLDEMMMITAIEDSTGTVEGWDFEAETAIDTAYLICGNLRAGMTAEQIMGMVTNAASDADTMVFLTALTAGAITFICPDLAYLIG